MKKILAYIFIVNLIFCNNNWIEYNNKLISSNSIVIMFEENQAPKLGLEEPNKLSDFPEIENIVFKYGVGELKPMFSFYDNFTNQHYKFHLHQYYKLEFNAAIEVISLIKDLSSSRIIKNIEFNYISGINIAPDDPYYLNQWAHNNNGQAEAANGNNVGTPDCDTDTNQAWDITTGDDDVIIAILDTGVNDHVEFEGRLINGYDFINNDSDAYDDNGHGTACAGIAAAKGNNGEGIAGVCWDCLIMPIKIMSFDGFGQDTQIANGVQWAADNGAQVISMSLGGGGYVSYFNDAINYATSIGSVVFAASGNDNGSNLSYPSGYDNCVSVGALSPCNERKSPNSCDGENYWGSNYGYGLNFLAPGVRIHTTNSSGGYTTTFNGTSSACPHAAGIAGLIFSADQTLSADAVTIIMQQTADDLGDSGYDIQTGYGRLNAYNALGMIVAGPVIELSEDSINLDMDINTTNSQNIMIYNNGEMDLQYIIDPYGYKSKNSDYNDNNYSWIDIADDYETIPFAHNDNASSISIDFDFDFPFYNNNYSTLIVNPNGWVGFGNDNSAWSNVGLPSLDAPLNAIMPFWDDLNPNNTNNSSDMAGEVKYQVNDDKIIIWYDNIRHWVGSGDVDGYYDFQIVLSINGNIDFNYRSMTGEVNSATIGIQDGLGTHALNIGFNNDLAHSELSINIQPRPSWLNISNFEDSIAPGESNNLNLEINTENLSSDLYNYILEINSNDFHNPLVSLPININVNDSSCSGTSLGDLNQDNELNVLDAILIVNIILYGGQNECDLILSDINNDANIDVIDIVGLINLILN